MRRGFITVGPRRQRHEHFNLLGIERRGRGASAVAPVHPISRPKQPG